MFEESNAVVDSTFLPTHSYSEVTDSYLNFTDWLIILIKTIKKSIDLTAFFTRWNEINSSCVIVIHCTFHCIDRIIQTYYIISKCIEFSFSEVNVLHVRYGRRTFSHKRSKYLHTVKFDRNTTACLLFIR